METNMITIPFDVERAKKIQAGEEPGKIVARCGRNARIVCWDMKGICEILALLACDDNDREQVLLYNREGKLHQSYEQLDDLILQVPEWTQFKDGDVLACEVDCGGGEYYKWYAILKGKVGHYSEGLHFDSYVSYNHDSSYKAGEIEFCEYSDNIDSIRLTTDEERQQLIDALKQSPASRAKEYLKRFFGIEGKSKYKFEPFDKVLVRVEDDYRWFATFFSHKGENEDGLYEAIDGIGYKYCIPYNEQTKHLLGTTDNWEE